MKIYFAGSYGRKLTDYQNTLDDFHLLLSYYYDKAEIAKRFAEKRYTFLDSGAFTAHTKGIVIDVDAYIDFINKYDEYLSVYAQVDEIPGTWGQQKTIVQLAEAPLLSWKNYLYMRERVKSPDKLLPIFHQGEDFIHLKRMLEFVPPIPYIGISSNKELHISDAEFWFSEVFSIIKKSPNPNVKTHAFGLTSFSLLAKFPFYSCDSTSWVRSAGMGSIMTDYGSICVSNRSSCFDNEADLGDPIRSVKSSYNAAEFSFLEGYVAKFGYSLKTLREEHYSRAMWNTDYILRKQKEYSLKPRAVKSSHLF